MDIKRARFRADSTIHDDKLISCLELNCHHTRPSRTSRKRSRPSNLHESGTDSDENVSEGERDSGLDEIVLKEEEGVSVAKTKKKRQDRKRRTKSRDVVVEMDVPLNDSASAPGSPKPKPVSHSKPKSRSKPRSSGEKPISAKSMKPRSKPRKNSGSGMEVTSGASEAEGVEEKPKKKRKV
jgi:hypothetical protein